MKILTMVIMLFVFMAGTPQESKAFDKKKHGPITDNVSSVYNAYAGHHGLKPLDDEAMKALARGSVCEDAATLTRANNWHFFDPNVGTKDEIKSEDTFFGTKNRSLHVRFNALIDELQAAIQQGEKRRDIYKIIGRILHYIEDMGVPAHTIPIYHASPEWYLKPLFWLSGEEILPDGFDSFVAPVDLLAEKKFMNDIYSITPSSGSDVKKQMNAELTGLANDTRKQVASDARWGHFWSLQAADPGRQGFKIYGEYGHLGFSDGEQGKCGGELSQRCQEFYRNRMKAVVKTSVALLAYVQSKFGKQLEP